MRTLKLLIPVFLIFTSVSFANVNKCEKDILISFYEATNGSNWNQTWDLNESVNSWFGITVENSHVVEINLSFNNLSGEIPSEIVNLPNLRVLNLHKIGRAHV